jgi:hypothetical protein
MNTKINLIKNDIHFALWALNLLESREKHFEETGKNERTKANGIF